MDDQRYLPTPLRHSWTWLGTSHLTAGLVLAVSSLLLLAGCLEREPGGEREPPAAPPQAEGIVRLTPAQVQSAGIRVSQVTPLAMPDIYSTLGRVVPRAGSLADVFAPFPGRLIVTAAGLLQVGSQVKQDDVLFEVEQQYSAAETLQLRAGETELQGRVEVAEQELAFARNEYTRAQKLFQGGAIPEKQMLAAELAAKQAQTRLENARAEKSEYEQASRPGGSVRRTPIRSPLSGVVVRTNFAAGQQVDPTKSLLTIADFDTVWVEAPVHEQLLFEIGQAARAEIIPAGAAGHRYIGRRVWSGQIVDPQNRTVPIMFVVNNRNRALKLGMSAEVRIERRGSTSRLAIPRSALLSRGATFFVFRETSQNVFEQRTVIVGPSDSSEVAIMDGLKEGDRVVVQGAQSLFGESSKGLIPTEEEE